MALALVAVSSVATAGPNAVQAPNGRYYEVFPASGISWTNANAAANLPTTKHLGVQGHLATINSKAEDEFVQSLNVPPGNRPELWIGGFQQKPCNFEPGCG